MNKSTKAPSTLQLRKDNAALTTTVSHLQDEHAAALSVIEDQKRSMRGQIEALSNMRYALDNSRRTVNELAAASPEYKRQLLALVVNDLMRVASEGGIPVCLFVGGVSGCTYHTTATVGNAIDMFTHVARESKNVRACIEHAIDLIDEVE